MLDDMRNVRVLQHLLLLREPHSRGKNLVQPCASGGDTSVKRLETRLPHSLGLILDGLDLLFLSLLLYLVCQQKLVVRRGREAYLSTPVPRRSLRIRRRHLQPRLAAEMRCTDCTGLERCQREQGSCCRLVAQWGRQARCLTAQPQDDCQRLQTDRSCQRHCQNRHIRPPPGRLQGPSHCFRICPSRSRSGFRTSRPRIGCCCSRSTGCGRRAQVCSKQNPPRVGPREDRHRQLDLEPCCSVLAGRESLGWSTALGSHPGRRGSSRHPSSSY